MGRIGPRGQVLEMGRFAFYVGFPIAMFYYFNLPEFYVEHIKPDLGRLHPTGPGINEVRHSILASPSTARDINAFAYDNRGLWLCRF